MKATLKVLKPVKKVSVSEWADSYRVLPSESAEPGHWKTSRVEYMRDVMDAFTQNGVHRVVVKAASQISKTECLLNVVGRFVHLDPATIMIIQPTLEMAQDFSRSRLSKMIADTKVLTPLFYPRTETILSKYFAGGRLVLQGANSAAGLASRPIRILLCDEVDRFPVSAADEGDPIDLAAKRQTTYFNYKTGIFSTPTTEGASRIEIEYKNGTQEQWQHQCPNCKEYHFLDYRQMKAEYTGAGSVIVKSVVYKCPDCGYEYTESEMKGAAQKYVVQNPDALKNHIRSFWINGFSSPWLSWEVIMREWLEARGNPAREAVVFNTRFGEVYSQRGEYENENEFLNRREDYPAELPQGVLLLTAAVDVQANRLEYEVTGWGVDEECWGIERGIVRGNPNAEETWRGLDAVLDKEYHFANDQALKIARTFIDSGYATSIVYAYCHNRRHKGTYPIKGKGGAGLKLLHQYTYPKHSNVILTILGVDEGKNEVFSRLSIERAGAGYFHFPREDAYKRGYDATYFKQLISEHRVTRRSGGLIHVSWEPVNAKARNESLDLRVYNLACMKSCVGNSKDFWGKQEAAMTKPRVVRQVPRQQEIDIWT